MKQSCTKQAYDKLRRSGLTPNDIAEKAGRSLGDIGKIVYGFECLATYRKEYAYYDGDTFIDVGTKEEIKERNGINESQFWYAVNRAHQGHKNGKLMIRC